MNWKRIASNWNEMTGKVKARWGLLSLEALATTNGRKEELVDLLHLQYGYAKDAAEKEIDVFAKSLKAC